VNVRRFDSGGKLFYFIFEGLGSLACGFYSTYVFFWLRDHYGFDNAANLGVAAGRGLIVALASWQGGRFAQRWGYYRALKLGLAGMMAALLAGGLSQGLAIQLLTVAVWTASTGFVWPALQALVSEGEAEAGLTRLLGIYNVVWGSCSALSYFFGGWLFDHLGARSIFWLPTGVFALMLGLASWLAHRHPVSPQRSRRAEAPVRAPEAAAFLQPVSPRTFLRMAWLANPFACIGLNTVLAMVPGLARGLHLSTTGAGFFCSIWFFARLAAFIVLWRWKGWHYRFRWLLAAAAGLVAGFAALLIGREFLVLVLAQMMFGLSVGLIYYSSLFYSMDVGETKGEHGGLHEAAMGAGNCVGPAMAATALLLAPQTANAGAYAVSALLTAGFVGLICLRLNPMNALRRRPEYREKAER
jgi:predicted MFS family arabinose efflux permease